MTKELQQFMARFKKVHSDRTYDLVESLIGQEVYEDVFVNSYLKVSTMKNSPSKRKKSAKGTYHYLIKNGVIKPKKRTYLI